jgi:hypothetical protein
MLTLKVVRETGKGDTITELFSAERISHWEKKREGGTVTEFPKNFIKLNEDLLETTDNLSYMESVVVLYNINNEIINQLVMLPYCLCYIMENGRTVDTFESKFV